MDLNHARPCYSVPTCSPYRNRRTLFWNRAQQGAAEDRRIDPLSRPAAQQMEERLLSGAITFVPARRGDTAGEQKATIRIVEQGVAGRCGAEEPSFSAIFVDRYFDAGHGGCALI